MIRNYFITALRQLAHQKGYALVNIIGLALGLTTVMLIFIWVSDEVSMNRFHQNPDPIYRVEQDLVFNGNPYHARTTSYPAAEGWKQEIPEIKEAVRIAPTGTFLCSSMGKKFYESTISAVDSTIFNVFTIPLELGDEGSALTEPYSIVLSAEMAQKYFGSENPLGKTITVNTVYNFKVTGVLKKIPSNSSLRFDLLVPFDFVKTIDNYNENWLSIAIQTFVVLQANTDVKMVEGKFLNVVKDHISGDISKTYEAEFILSPLRKLYLHEYSGFGHPPGRIQGVIVFSITGFLILIIAAINYMNLSTARSSKRSREIGLRKLFGSQKINLVTQFIGESLLTTLIALGLALLMVALLLDSFGLVSGKYIRPDVFFSPVFIAGVALITLFTAFISGLYPALFLSKFKPIFILAGDPANRKGKGWLRKILLVFQFCISVSLITYTLLIFNQLRYMQERNPGYDQENVVSVKLLNDMKSKYPVLRQSLGQNPDIAVVSGSESLPCLIGSFGKGITWEGKSPEVDPLIGFTQVDVSFPELLQVPLVAGRTFSLEYPSDKTDYGTGKGAFLINETLAKIIDQPNLIGMNLTFNGITGPIIGELKDFHFRSMNTEIMPLVLTYDPGSLNYCLIRLKPGDVAPTIGRLRADWNRILPEFPFEPVFITETSGKMYQNESNTGKLVLYFTIMAIIIACLGLIGLSGYLAEQKTHEIGIRKTLGASHFDIIAPMVGQFTWLVLVAILLSLPITILYSKKYLQSFAYPVDLSWWLFVIPALGAIFLTLIMVTLQALKASRTSPAVSLKYR